MLEHPQSSTPQLGSVNRRRHKLELRINYIPYGVQIFEGSIFRGFEKSSLIQNVRGYRFSRQ